MSVPPALDAGAVARLAADIADASSGDVLVLHAEARDPFCRGLALPALTTPPSADLLEGLRRYADLLLMLATGPHASVAVIEGGALGGGLGLATACDVVLATPDARFGLPETSAGLPPFIVWAVLARRMTIAARQRLALDGRAVTATEALQLGLVDHVVPPHELTRSVTASVRQLARVPSETTALVKSHPPHAVALREALDTAVEQTWRRLHDGDVVRALAERLEIA